MQNQSTPTATPVKPVTDHYIAMSKYGWGKSESPNKAISLCKKNAPRGKHSGEIKVYSVHPETAAFGDGSWEYPKEHAPVLVSVHK